MSIPYHDLELLFDWASPQSFSISQAWVHRTDGRTYVSSDFDGHIDEPPPEDLDSDDWLAIPDKRSLDLGTSLVFAFAAAQLSAEQKDRVYAIFRRKGAYRRWNVFLNYIGQRDNWHAFKNRREEDAIRAWAKEQGLTIQDKSPPATQDG